MRSAWSRQTPAPARSGVQIIRARSADELLGGLPNSFGVACNTSLAQGVAAQRDWLSAQSQSVRDFYEFL